MEKQPITCKDKRGRKRKYENDSEGNKLRSRKHRNLKKDYVKSLETKIDELNEKVAELTSEVDYYKSLLNAKKIDIYKDTDDVKFLREEDFHFDSLPNLIKKAPELVKSSTHMNQWEREGNVTEQRIKLIKNAFNVLYNFGVPKVVKVCGVLYKDINENTPSQYNKYQTLSKIQRAEFIKQEKISKLMSVVFDYENSLGVLDWISSNSDLMEHTYFNMREGVHELIKIQNKMIKTLDEGDKMFMSIMPKMGLNLLNQSTILFKSIKTPEFLNKYCLWDIPKKKENSEKLYDDLYLSESDNGDDIMSSFKSSSININTFKPS